MKVQLAQNGRYEVVDNHGHVLGYFNEEADAVSYAKAVDPSYHYPKEKPAKKGKGDFLPPVHD